MPKSALPTHFIVYPEWLAIDAILGKELTSRYVNATILGGTRMVAHEADYSLLGSADKPLDDAAAAVLDRLDVADLESEAAHGYELFWATRAEDRVFEDDARKHVDGGRAGRTLDRFHLALAPGGTLVARLASEDSVSVSVRVDGSEIGKLALSPGAFHDYPLTLPASVAPGVRRIEIVAAEHASFAALHYFSLAAHP
jgi:hypothetical protein